MAQFKGFAHGEPAKASRVKADLHLLRQVAIEQEQGEPPNSSATADILRYGTLGTGKDNSSAPRGRNR